MTCGQCWWHRPLRPGLLACAYRQLPAASPLAESLMVTVTASCLTLCLHLHVHLVRDDQVLQRESLRILCMHESCGLAR